MPNKNCRIENENPKRNYCDSSGSVAKCHTKLLFRRFNVCL